METSETDAYEFVRVCISQQPKTARRRRLQSLIDAGLDWEAICREAGRHGVQPLVFRNLEHLLGRQLPSWLDERVQEYEKKNRIHTSFLVRELGEIHRRCEEDELPLLVLKGPVLANAAYGDVAMRQYVDLDVFVPRERFREFDRLLKDAGYEYPERRKKIKGWRRSLFHSLKGQWQFRRAGGAFNLDVHTRLMPPGYSFPSDFQRFWGRARPVRLNEEVTVQGFSPEDRLLVLVHHGVKNQWRALRHVVDIAGVVGGSNDLDWELLISRAEKMQTTRALKLGLYMAYDLLNMTLPSRIEEWSSEPAIRDIAAPLKAYLQNPPEKSGLTFGRRVQLHLATKDTLAGQIRYGVYSLVQHIWSALIKP